MRAKRKKENKERKKRSSLVYVMIAGRVVLNAFYWALTIRVQQSTSKRENHDGMPLFHTWTVEYCKAVYSNLQMYSLY